MKGIRDWGLDVRGSGFGTRDSGRKNAPRLRSWGIGGGRRTLPSPLSPRPSPLAPRGITLLEVLVSIFILAVGLLGVAALIPIGKLALVKTNISDRTGACGRAAMRDVEVRRMLNPASWALPTGVGAFAIDPLGTSIGPLGPLPRTTLLVAPSVSISPEIFRWQDDLPFVQSEDETINGDRPVLAGTTSEGNFSWFLTVCPSPSDIALLVLVGLRRNYTVSVVVCYKRNLTGGGEQAVAVSSFLGGGYGGGTIQLALPVSDIVKTDQWVMLTNSVGVPVVAKWYRVVGVGADYLSLVGPDWDPTVAATMVVVEGVTGVYTTTVHLDADCIWSR